MASIKGLNKVLNNLRQEGKDITECLFVGIDNALELGQADAKMNAPVGDSGYLRETIFKHTQKNKTKIEGCIYSTAEYDPYVEFGTGPTGDGSYKYKINGVSLRYRASKWRVKIPFLVTETDKGIRYISGQKANPHMYPAFLLVQDNIIKEVKKASRR